MQRVVSWDINTTSMRCLRQLWTQVMMMCVLIVLLRIETVTAQTGLSRQQLTAYPYGVHYEIFVRAFCDSNGDGIGDIKGMTSKLDYLQELGVTGIWLMPIFKSPSYHKYDVVDYYEIDPEYGTLQDFKEFLREAHKRNIGVTIDFVVNHTSSKHSWFLSARNDPQSKYRAFYNWVPASDTTKQWNADWKNGWKTIGDVKYECVFWEEMPDLNFDNKAVRDEVMKAATYWVKTIGVDGLRIDAAMHIYGVMNNKPKADNAKSVAYWAEFSKAIKKVKPSVYLVGEVWARDTLIAPYQKYMSAFNFDLALAIEHAVQEANTGVVQGYWIGDNKPPTSSAPRIHIIDLLLRAYSLYRVHNARFLDASFLTNHDQNRIISDFNNDPMKARTAAKILLTLPGTPYLYYGEEIGMRGKKPDEYLREPMLWDKKSAFVGETRWIAPRYNIDSMVVPVVQQKQDTMSLWHTYKTFIRLRNTIPALAHGDITPVKSFPPNVLVFTRKHKNQTVLVMHNLSGNTMLVSLGPDAQSFKKTIHISQGSRLMGGGVQLNGGATIILEK